jgi:UDP-N-acetylglucosamine:LPS N-acetylglucosamine transferase
MVSYLGAGVPILYHGPASSAAGQYLRRNGAALQLNSNAPDEIATTLDNAFDDASALNRVSENAQNAVRRDFDAVMLKCRFWDAISS